MMNSTRHLIDTKTYLGFFDQKGAVKVERVLDFMDISRAELAAAFGFTGDQLRPERMAVKTREAIAELAGAIEYVAGVFNGNEEKTRKWFNVPNVHFGGSAPKKIILTGRFHRIKSFIYSNQSR